MLKGSGSLLLDRVKVARLLKEATEELENRVQARTLELEALLRELERNTRSKTHYYRGRQP